MVEMMVDKKDENGGGWKERWQVEIMVNRNDDGWKQWWMKRMVNGKWMEIMVNEEDGGQKRL